MGKRSIKVDKNRLIERLQEHRDRHQREYQEAVGGYKSRLVFALQRMLEAAKRKEDVSHTIDLEIPKDHTNEYETALAIMEWEQDDILHLTQGEFERYALDAWPWKKRFMQIHAGYIIPQTNR